MDSIDKIMFEFINELNYDEATKMFKHISSGKKLRSKLVLKIANENETSLRLCAIIELIHLASLLHDDVIDEANTRRGQPSINALFGVKNSIMLGDILYSKGFYELTNFSPKIAKIIANAVSLLSVGELMDVKLSENFNDDATKYMQMIYYKTAVLIEASARCGAILAGLDDESFGIYGKNLGLAFQIVDDILDITQDAKTLGKPNLNDFKEGKTTLPYIYLYEILDKNEREILKSFHAKSLNDDEILWIKERLGRHKIIEKTILEAKNLAQISLNAVNGNAELSKIVTSMIDREF